MRRLERPGDHTYVRRGWASAYRRSRAASAFSQFSTQIFNFLSLLSRYLLRFLITLHSSKSTPILNFPLRFSIFSPFPQFSIILYSSQPSSESFTFSQFSFHTFNPLIFLSIFYSDFPLFSHFSTMSQFSHHISIFSIFLPVLVLSG